MKKTVFNIIALIFSEQRPSNEDPLVSDSPGRKITDIRRELDQRKMFFHNLSICNKMRKVTTAPVGACFRSFSPSGESRIRDRCSNA